MNFIKHTTVFVMLLHSVFCSTLTTKQKCQECFDEESDPVCGTDKITYFNECEFNCTKIFHKIDVEILHDGLCKDDHRQPNNCTSDDVQSTTPSIVPIPDIGGNEIPQTLCDPVENCDCNYDLLPVCGSNSITYPNECSLHCATKCVPGLHIAKRGFCNSVSALKKSRQQLA